MRSCSPKDGSDVDPTCTQDKDRVIISSLELRSCVGGDSAIIELFTWIILDIFIFSRVEENNPKNIEIKVYK